MIKKDDWVGCGPEGWSEIITDLRDVVTWLERNYDVEVDVGDIKEKFGGLRFYYNMSGGEKLDQADWILDGAVQMAENESERTCMTCGHPGKRRNAGGWIHTLCEEHWQELLDRRGMREGGHEVD